MALLFLASFLFGACTLLSGTMDKKSGLTERLSDTETYIESGAWGKAADSAEEARKAWERVKPLLQIDVDHDYVNDIDFFFVNLVSFIDTQNKPEALSNLRLIKHSWDNISGL